MVQIAVLFELDKAVVLGGQVGTSYVWHSGFVRRSRQVREKILDQTPQFTNRAHKTHETEKRDRTEEFWH